MYGYREESEELVKSYAAKRFSLLGTTERGKRVSMSVQIVFNGTLGVLFILNGIRSLRRAQRGSLRASAFVTIATNPIEPEQMTPGTRDFTWYLGVASLALGALFIARVIYHIS
jgi:hypothetical protein